MHVQSRKGCNFDFNLRVKRFKWLIVNSYEYGVGCGGGRVDVAAAETADT